MATNILTPALRSRNNAIPKAGNKPIGQTGGIDIDRKLLGLLLFLGAEIMFFAGLISAFLILRANADVWPPPMQQPRLPVLVTGFNTLVLFMSAISMSQTVRNMRAGNASVAVGRLAIAAILGVFFVAIQGSEWAYLVSYGLTATSSTYGAIFYTLIGCHTLHVLAGLVILLVTLDKAKAGAYTALKYSGLERCSVYWYFVVGIWPALYMLVYLDW